MGTLRFAHAARFPATRTPPPEESPARATVLGSQQTLAKLSDFCSQKNTNKLRILRTTTAALAGNIRPVANEVTPCSD